jgi:hypothetical protein
MVEDFRGSTTLAAGTCMLLLLLLLVIVLLLLLLLLLLLPNRHLPSLQEVRPPAAHARCA